MSNKSVVKTFKQMRRQRRVRKKVQGTPERPRMSVFRSNRNVFVQVIDDLNGRTLVSCSSLDKEIASVPQQGKKKTEISIAVGEQVAKKALEKGIKAVVFDRNRYEYHGRVRGVAEGARKAGLEF